MNRLLLPCLRGSIGNWVTYTCLMRLKEIVELVSFAEDIHKSKKLSNLIQRELKKDRQKEIGEYLLHDKEAFFNSLVVAIYDGEPKWHQFDSIDSTREDLKGVNAPEYALECFGYLSITKKERMFAIDGQHRLSGIQYAVEKNDDLGYQQIPVIFIPHYNNEIGLKRTRRLFTTLNKKAKPVNRAAVISLDEDDLSACATRFLVEESLLFNENRIKFQANNSISYSDIGILTTIGNLYDIVRFILQHCLFIDKNKIDNFRDKQSIKEEYFNTITYIFDCMFKYIPALNEYHLSTNKPQITELYRRKFDGGHFLFRPIGLKVYIMALSKYIKIQTKLNSEINPKLYAEDFIRNTSTFNFNLTSKSFLNILWDDSNKKIIQLKAEHRDAIISELINFPVSC